MAAKDTRRQILNKALELFSVNGFEAVSVRTLAGAVGIKESSLYFHFTNKRAVLEELLEQFHAEAHELIIPLREGVADVRDMDEERFVMLSMVFYLHFLNNQRLVLFIRLCMIEQHRQPQVAKYYDELILRMPLDIYAAAFAAMKEGGEGLAAQDAALMYYGNMIYAFQAQLARGQEREAAFVEMEPRLRRIFRLGV